jgi:hypothetical protein
VVVSLVLALHEAAGVLYSDAIPTEAGIRPTGEVQSGSP